MPTSPTQRTLTRLRRESYLAQVVEKWNAHANVRQDLFGFVDVVAIHPHLKHLLFVQATTHTNVLARVKKIATDCTVEARACLDAGVSVEVWGWRKIGRKWDCTIRRVRREDLAGKGPERSKRAARKAKRGKQREFVF